MKIVTVKMTVEELENVAAHLASSLECDSLPIESEEYDVVIAQWRKESPGYVKERVEAGWRKIDARFHRDRHDMEADQLERLLPLLAEVGDKKTGKTTIRLGQEDVEIGAKFLKLATRSAKKFGVSLDAWIELALNEYMDKIEGRSAA